MKTLCLYITRAWIYFYFDLCLSLKPVTVSFLTKSLLFFCLLLKILKNKNILTTTFDTNLKLQSCCILHEKWGEEPYLFSVLVATLATGIPSKTISFWRKSGIASNHKQNQLAVLMVETVHHVRTVSDRNYFHGQLLVMPRVAYISCRIFLWWAFWQHSLIWS